MLKKMIEEIRKQIPSGEVDAVVVFDGEFVTRDDEQQTIPGKYIVEVRVDENNELNPVYTSVQKFIEDETGEEFDPGISFSEFVQDFDSFPFKIESVRAGN